ncbi:MAG: hypothetical protein COX57_09935 [Alphaproteobacteria bacterium CG_4_10_14_0_2_um_filter_63_37]|nr:MAG: hypothetical protein COX57_09935 [Alphaproteobacteria bacterium CG_4_10_14_0_2_um_filter_63_37]
MGSDLLTFEEGLKAAMRENPDIIQAGEIRDVRMVEIALTAAETGHLVLATVHANTSLNALLRLLAVFKQEDQPLARSRLAENLRAIITQRLLPRVDRPGRVAACDVLINNSVIQTLIRDPDRTDEIPKQMAEGRTIYGSQTLDQNLMELIEAQEIKLEHALEQAVHPEDLRMKLNLSGKFDMEGL